MSPPFSPKCAWYPLLIKLSHTKDIITKKMIYLYLINNSEGNSQLALMAINSFARDCDSKDQKLKGLALRSLCSLKFDGVYDYIKPHVLKMLHDQDPYVKKTAINGCMKLHYLNPQFVDGIIYSKRKRHNQHAVQYGEGRQRDGGAIGYQRPQRDHE